MSASALENARLPETTLNPEFTSRLVCRCNGRWARWDRKSSQETHGVKPDHAVPGYGELLPVTCHIDVQSIVEENQRKMETLHPPSGPLRISLPPYRRRRVPDRLRGNYELMTDVPSQSSAIMR